MSSRKLQGTQKRPQNSIKSKDEPILFPSGLKYSHTYNDPDQMSVMASEWDQEYFQVSSGSFKGHLEAAHTNSLQIIRESWEPGIFVQGSIPEKSVVFSMSTNKNPPPILQYCPLQTTELALLRESDDIDLLSKCPLELLILSIDKELLERYSTVLLGKEFDSLNIHNNRLQIRDESTSRELMHFWDYVINLLLSPNIDLQDTGFLAKIEEEIVSSILYSILMPANAASRTERQLAARLAKEFMIENKDKQITILDICEAVGTTERTLHLGFKELYGISPKAFMKILRLNYVRRELMCAEPGSTVIDTAYKWNFYHLSRFAKSYYQMFNEYPSDTLKHCKIP